MFYSNGQVFFFINWKEIELLDDIVLINYLLKQFALIVTLLLILIQDVSNPKRIYRKVYFQLVLNHPCVF